MLIASPKILTEYEGISFNTAFKQYCTNINTTSKFFLSFDIRLGPKE